VCVAILQIANARSHFSPGEAANFYQAPARNAPAAGDFSTWRRFDDDKHEYGGMSTLAADAGTPPAMTFGSPCWRFGQYRRRWVAGKMSSAG
jgi:hypothetical protein